MNSKFDPSFDAFISKPVSPIAAKTAMVLGLLAVMVVLWMIFAKIDIVATATGSIIPVGKSKEVQSATGGVVIDIRVKDGDPVEIGDVLIRLDAVEHEVNLRLINQQLETAKADTYQFQALLGQDPYGTFVARMNQDHPLYDQYLALIKDRLDVYHQQYSGIVLELEEAGADLVKTQNTLEMLVKIEPLLIDQFEAQETLFGKGYTSKPKYLSAQQRLIENQYDQRDRDHQITKIKASISRLNMSLAEHQSEFMAAVGEEAIDAGNRVDQFEEELLNALHQESHSIITAPISGIVHEMNVNIEGAVVYAAEPILTIIPIEKGLEVEAFILNKDIGFIRPGQEANIKIATFPFTKYGSLNGHVLSVSRDALTLAPAGSPEGEAVNAKEMAARKAQATPGTIFKARVHIDDDPVMNIDGHEVELSPGMAVTVNIKTGKRTVMDFLLSTMWRYTDESLKER